MVADILMILTGSCESRSEPLDEQFKITKNWPRDGKTGARGEISGFPPHVPFLTRHSRMVKASTVHVRMISRHRHQ